MPPDVFVGSSEAVSDALRVSEAEIAEEISELTIELVTEAAVPVAESVDDPEASEFVDDIFGLSWSTRLNSYTRRGERSGAPNGEQVKKTYSQRVT